MVEVINATALSVEASVVDAGSDHGADETGAGIYSIDMQLADILRAEKAAKDAQSLEQLRAAVLLLCRVIKADKSDDVANVDAMFALSR